MTREPLFRRATSQIAVDNGDEILMMSLCAGSYFALSGPAQRIWTLAVAPISLEQIVERLILEYDVDRETCRGQVATFLAELDRKSVV